MAPSPPREGEGDRAADRAGPCPAAAPRGDPEAEEGGEGRPEEEGACRGSRASEEKNSLISCQLSVRRSFWFVA